MSGRGGGFNAAIHGARGLFSLMVFAFHVANSGLGNFLAPGSAIETWFFLALKSGVELFFGISGFVIVGALARAPSVRSFLWDRVTRIYPLLWITVLAITGASLAAHHWLPPLGDWLLNFLAPPPFFPLPQVNPAAWSLGYEISFYALCAVWWGVGIRFGRGWRHGVVALGIILLLLFPRAALMPAGVLIAAGHAPRGALALAARVPAMALLGFLLVWRGTEFGMPNVDIAQANPLALPFGRWLATVPLLLAGAALGWIALLGIVQQHGPLPRLLTTRLFQWLGTVSFSFYLWHPVVMSFAKSALRGAGVGEAPYAQALFLVIALPPSLAIAHVSQRRIEVALTRRLRAMGPRESRPHAPIAAVAGDPALTEAARVRA